MPGINLKILRQFFAWNFAFISLSCAVLSVLFVLRSVRFLHALPSHPLLFFVYAVFPAEALIFGVAWWKIWKQKSASRVWGIGGSVVLIIHPVYRVIRFPRSLHGYHVIVLAVAIAGIIVFSLNDKAMLEQDDEVSEVQPSNEA